jgi:hypothetical protein
VYSKCSAASGMIASEILQLQRNIVTNSINANMIKALKNNNMPVNLVAQIERGLSMEMANYAYNFQIMQKKGYSVEIFANFVGILLYFYFEHEVLIPLGAEPPAHDAFAFGQFQMNPEILFLKIRKYQPTYNINLILKVSLPCIDVYHAIHLLTCANNKQYVYDNNNKTIISSKWLSYFMTPYDDFVQGFYIASYAAEAPNKKYNLIFELLFRHVTYLKFGIRTFEQIENSITRTVNMQENARKKRQYALFHSLVFKNVGIRTDSTEFLTDGIGLEPTQKIGEIHTLIEEETNRLFNKSLFFKLFEEHKPTFFVLTTTHLYFICKESVKKISIEKLENDTLWNVAVHLLKEPKNVILFLMNLYENRSIYMMDTMWPIGFTMFTPK